MLRVENHQTELNAPVAQLVEHRAAMPEFDSGRTITHGLKITEEKVLPLQLHPHMVRLSRIRTTNRRPRLTIPSTFKNVQCETLKNPHTIRKE